MKIVIISHVLDRMEKYSITEEMVMRALQFPDSVEEGHSNRKIHQKKLNGHVIRLVVEETEQLIRVITVYKARSERYEV